jgi:hypothetical protein
MAGCSLVQLTTLPLLGIKPQAASLVKVFTSPAAAAGSSTAGEED